MPPKPMAQTESTGAVRCYTRRVMEPITEPCPDCGLDPCLCLLVGAEPSPGDLRRAWMREHPGEQPPA